MSCLSTGNARAATGIAVEGRKCPGDKLMWMLHTGMVFPTACLLLFRKPSPIRASVCGDIHTLKIYFLKSFRSFCSFFHLIILTKASSVPRHFFWPWPNSSFVSYLLDLGVFLYFTPSRDPCAAPALPPLPPQPSSGSWVLGRVARTPH